jgi:hypothetical protein
MTVAPRAATASVLDPLLAVAADTRLAVTTTTTAVVPLVAIALDATTIAAARPRRATTTILVTATVAPRPVLAAQSMSMELPPAAILMTDMTRAVLHAADLRLIRT